MTAIGTSEIRVKFDTRGLRVQIEAMRGQLATVIGEATRALTILDDAAKRLEEHDQAVIKVRLDTIVAKANADPMAEDEPAAEDDAAEGDGVPVCADCRKPFAEGEQPVEAVGRGMVHGYVCGGEGDGDVRHQVEDERALPGASGVGPRVPAAAVASDPVRDVDERPQGLADDAAPYEDREAEERGDQSVAVRREVRHRDPKPLAADWEPSGNTKIRLAAIGIGPEYVRAYREAMAGEMRTRWSDRMFAAWAVEEKSRRATQAESSVGEGVGT